MYNIIYQCKLCKKILLEEIYGETDQSISIKLINDKVYANKKSMFVITKR